MTILNTIEALQLTRKFGELSAVDRVSFLVDKGEIFGLLGPNGAGKSTLIRMLCTLLRPTTGTARVAGIDILNNPSEVRKHIGLVTEKIILYERLTAEENLLLFGRLNHLASPLIKKRSDNLLKLLGMQEWRKKSVGTFSIGMKQRINIARALLHQPEILFLDEPTLGLDLQTTCSLHELIRKLSIQGMTIVLTTHAMSDAEQLAKRIAIIDRGEIISQGTPVELKKDVFGTDAYFLDINMENHPAALINSLEKLNSVTSLTHQEEGHIRIHTNGSRVVGEIIDAIQASHTQIKTINTTTPSLGDVFLHLTGREMRNEATEDVSSLRLSHRKRRVSRRVR